MKRNIRHPVRKLSRDSAKQMELLLSDLVIDQQFSNVEKKVLSGHVKIYAVFHVPNSFVQVQLELIGTSSHEEVL